MNNNDDNMSREATLLDWKSGHDAKDKTWMTQEAALLDCRSGPKPQKNCCPPCWYTCLIKRFNIFPFVSPQIKYLIWPSQKPDLAKKMKLKGWWPDSPGSLPCSAPNDKLRLCSKRNGEQLSYDFQNSGKIQNPIHESDNDSLLKSQGNIIFSCTASCKIYGNDVTSQILYGKLRQSGNLVLTRWN